MNDNLKKRLIGAIVLASLAVIFVPMLLSGPEEHASSRRDSIGIPPKPDYRFRPIEIPLDPTDEEQPQGAVVVETEEQARQAAAAEPTPQGGRPRPQAPSVPEPAPATEKSAAATGWVVQVGSFSRSKNAFALRDKLRTAGLAAFVEQVMADGQRIYRVRIGPEVSREAAEALQERVVPHVGNRGLVLQHP